MKQGRMSWLIAVAVGLTASAVVAQPAAGQDKALPTCPGVFAHGGYPTGDDPWDRDQLRQPNHPAGLAEQADLGSEGVEVDLQLTRDGHKAVMWHNRTTNGLTGSSAAITDLWWTGDGQLQGRTITHGPFEGETVYTLRQFLDSANDNGIVPLIEIKGYAAQSLLNSDAEIADRAWSEVLEPIAERVERQEILLGTNAEDLKPELKARAEAAGLESVIEGGPHRPVWPDSVDWEEPPPSWEGNAEAWQEALDEEPQRIATSWPADLHTWLDGKCE